MRAALVLVLAAACLMLATASAGAGPLACDLGSGGSQEYMDRLGPLLGGAAEEAEAVLGAQIAGYWLSERDQGWDMGLAPGPLTIEDARAAIAERLNARFAPDDAAYLISVFHLYEMPYADAELKPVANDLTDLMAAQIGRTILWTVGVGCLDGEAWRVEVGLYSDATPEDIAAVREIVAPYGDRVRVYLDGLVDLPNAGGGSVASRLKSFISLRSPRRCVRASTIRFKTRRSARQVIRRVTLTVSGRKRVLSGDRLATPLTIRLRRRVTRVKVVVRVGNGSRLARTYVYSRC
jgi:hypothetical protein